MWLSSQVPACSPGFRPSQSLTPPTSWGIIPCRPTAKSPCLLAQVRSYADVSKVPPHPNGPHGPHIGTSNHRPLIDADGGHSWPAPPWRVPVRGGGGGAPPLHGAGRGALGPPLPRRAQRTKRLRAWNEAGGTRRRYQRHQIGTLGMNIHYVSKKKHDPFCPKKGTHPTWTFEFSIEHRKTL